MILMLAVFVAGSFWMFFHLRFYGLFTFMGQEERLFPFDEKGCMPINPVECLGNWLTHFYLNPTMAVMIPTVSLALLLVTTWYWLRHISGKSITVIALAIIPVMVMLPWLLTDNCPLYAVLTLVIIMLAACINNWLGMACMILAVGHHLYANPSSLSFALQSPEVLASQTYSSPAITAAWSSWIVAMLFVTTGALLLRIKQISKFDKWMAPIAIVAVLAWSYTTLPDSETQMPKLRKDQMATLERLGRWQQLEALLTQTKPQDMVELTYLNLALAQQGKLGDTMFQHAQHGAEGIYCQDNGSYQVNALYSDIFYLTGYLSRAEGHAMDAKQIGMPRHLRRLAEIHTIRGEKRLADKYLNVLSRLSNHSQWVDEMRQGKVELPVAINGDSLLLTSMSKTMDVWASQLTVETPNRAAAEYLGAIYLLDKDLQSFKTFYLAWQNNKALGKMPRHFDEAAAIIASHDSAFATKANIDKQILSQFASIESQHAPSGTYWNYYESLSIP